MSNNSYELYIQSCIALASTLVIKSEESAEGLNKYIAELYGPAMVNGVAPEDWLYYKELAGEYHFSHERMYVVSMDTMERIEFSKENLELHRATRREYSYGTRYYKELLAAYPNQEALILGILNPVDKQKAIDAYQWEIVGWDESFVESNEYSLIKELQFFIDGYRARWVNAAYNNTDELNPAWDFGRMGIVLIPAIVTLRNNATKTREVHTYHIRQYLQSNGFLDAYIDFLTKEQQLWLYRNIQYLKHNPGHQETFEWLIDNVLTTRTIPLAEFTMRHNLSGQPEEDYPTLSFRRSPLNLGYNVDPVSNIPLETIMTKEIPLARDNADFYAEAVEEVQESMVNSVSNVVLTKAVESSMFDLTGATPWALEDILLNEWLHLATTGVYKAVIAITNPRTSERIPLSVKDAFALMLYCQWGSIGQPLEYVEDVAALRVQRIPGQTLAGLKSMVNLNYVTEPELKELLATQPILLRSDEIISTEAFFNTCVDIFDAAQIQRKMIAVREHQYKRGLMHGAVTSMYCDAACKLSDTRELYGKWLVDRNIKIADFTQNELSLMALDVLRAATGLSLTTTKSMKDVQRALVRLMGQLSSYSIQFLTSINDESIKVFDWPMIRIGDSFAKVFGDFDFIDVPVRLKEVHARASQKAMFDFGNCGVFADFEASVKEYARLEIIVQPHLPDSKVLPTVWHYRMDSAPVYISHDAPPPESLEDVTKTPNMLDFSYLSQAEWSTMRDIYNQTAGD